MSRNDETRELLLRTVRQYRQQTSRRVADFSDTQRQALESLWFVYGNNGKRHTGANHKFLQGILERGTDERYFYCPSPRLIQKVDEILMRLDNE